MPVNTPNFFRSERIRSFISLCSNVLSVRSIWRSSLALSCVFACSVQAANVGWTTNITLNEEADIYLDFASGTVFTSEPTNYNFRLLYDGGSDPRISIRGNPNDTVNKVIYSPSNPIVAESFDLDASIDAGSGSYWSLADFAYYNSSFSRIDTDFPAGETGYAGVQLQISGSTYYGWISLIRDEDSVFGTLTGFGYNNTAGQAATTGAVPEPQTLGLLIAAGLGLYIYRFRFSRKLV